MRLDEFYRLTKDILQIERKDKNFHLHLKKLLGAYLESYRHLDDSCFKEGAEGKFALMNEIQKVCDGIEECLDLYSCANLGACIEKMREIISLIRFAPIV